MPHRTLHFHSLDVLRGVAALIVVFWHWQHFAFIPPNAIADPRTQPLYDVFFIFYGSAWMAVDLFFALSGFIFFWLYARAIADGRVSGWDFFVRRFSRLYPLHLVTLLVVAAGQWAFLRLTGHFFVYRANTQYHFILNLFLASVWDLKQRFSFNGPIWSVSVEVGLYAAFFVLCRFVFKHMPRAAVPVLAVLATFGFAMIGPAYGSVARGIGGFFLGGLVYHLYERLVNLGYDRPLAWVLPGISVAAWAAALLRARSLIQSFGSPWRSDHAEDYWPVLLVLFPLTILTLAIVETRRGTLGRRVSFIGHMSYSSYLIHFPMQLATAIIVTRFAIDPVLFRSPWFLLTFFLVLAGLSIASYYFFEAPAQRWLRARLTVAAPAARLASGA